MKKALIITSLILGIIALPEAFAQSCAGSLGNLDFYHATIDEKKNVHCSYRYCYYNCIYNTYRINGTFRPDSNLWEPKDGYFVCDSYNSNHCSFKYDTDAKKVH